MYRNFSFSQFSLRLMSSHDYKFVFCQISAISNPERKLRVHSWYGGPASKSFAVSTSDFQQSPADSNTSPYVVLPPECGTFQIQGTTTDHTNDDWEIPKRSRIDSKGCVADTSSSSLDHFYLSNLPWNSTQQSTSWNQEVPSQLPLLECYSPPPVIDKESYITMNDALSSSDRLGSVGSEDQYYEKSTSEKHLHRSMVRVGTIVDFSIFLNNKHVIGIETI